RMRPGELLVLFNGTGGEYEAVIESVDRRVVLVRVESFREVERESPLNVTLAQCVSKGERMDYAVQKAVELGVQRIVPLLSSRGVVRLDAERWERKLAHWRGVVAAACEQSGRTRVPHVDAVQKLEAWLPSAPAGTRLLLAPEGAASLRHVRAPSAPTLLVGPEGGLAEEEIEHARRYDFQPVGLGPRVLRTETAGVAALAAMQALWGDLG
ncbi:MAG: 16S rRNA (uracil(1498)-N(3))-methyltransferase, partial [Nevskia sp.]|nr:16S rRNA (uracil(1498)-N(3))-methyltransferase [Nevskia sp.]